MHGQHAALLAVKGILNGFHLSEPSLFVEILSDLPSLYCVSSSGRRSSLLVFTQSLFDPCFYRTRLDLSLVG